MQGVIAQLCCSGLSKEMGLLSAGFIEEVRVELETEREAM